MVPAGNQGRRRGGRRLAGTGTPHSGAALWARPGLVVFSGTADMMSNILFLLATRTGTLSASTVLVSRYPVVVVKPPA